MNGDADVGLELGGQVYESPEVIADGLAKEGGDFPAYCMNSGLATGDRIEESSSSTLRKMLLMRTTVYCR